MWKIEKEFTIKLGGNYYVDAPDLIVAGGKSLFRIRRRDSDGRLAIDFDVYDSKGAKVATIRNSNVVSGNRNDYRIQKEAGARYWVTDRKTGKTICDIRKAERSEIGTELEISVDLFTKSGHHILLGPEATVIGRTVLVANRLVGGGISVP